MAKHSFIAVKPRLQFVINPTGNITLSADFIARVKEVAFKLSTKFGMPAFEVDGNASCVTAVFSIPVAFEKYSEFFSEIAESLSNLADYGKHGEVLNQILALHPDLPKDQVARVQGAFNNLLSVIEDAKSPTSLQARADHREAMLARGQVQVIRPEQPAKVPEVYKALPAQPVATQPVSRLPTQEELKKYSEVKRTDGNTMIQDTK